MDFRRQQKGCDAQKRFYGDGAVSRGRSIVVMGFGNRKEWEPEDEIDEVIPLDETLLQADFSYEDDEDDDDAAEFPPLADLEDFDGDDLS